MSAPGPPTIIRKKRKRRSRRPPIFPFVAIAVVAAGMIWGGIKIWRLLTGLGHEPPGLTGFIGDTSKFRQEYLRYYGKQLADNEVATRFENAVKMAGKRNYAGAASELETVTKQAALPLVFTDIGILYCALADYSNAVQNFREVFGRDFDYTAARQFLKDVKLIPPRAVDPVTLEQEPNNESRFANLIAMDSTVTGDVGGVNGDIDYFRLVTPRAPRDLITVEIINNTVDFTPHLHVMDGSLRTLDWGERISRRGESVKVTGAPPPNSTLYLGVSAFESPGGSYSLRTTALKAYDRYEPNDELTDASRISLGEDVPASVMDAIDTDYYSFVSPRKGTVTVEIRNRSATLIPSLTVYDAERRAETFSPQAQKPGASLTKILNVDKDITYYLQVSSHGGTAGAYTLRVD